MSGHSSSQSAHSDSHSHAHSHSAHGASSEPKVTPVELFFDLVFVYAITQVTQLLLSDLTPVGFARSGLALFMVWWAWSQYTWMANAIGPAGKGTRLGMLVATVPTFLCAFTLPGLYRDTALWFGASYFLVREIGLVLYWFGLSHDREHQSGLRTFIPFASLAPMLVLAGGFVSSELRTWLFALGMLIDVVGALNAGKGTFRIWVAHFAERYSLIVIIAMGESVIAIGIGAAQAHLDLALLAGIVVMLAGVVALFWSYFDWTYEATEHRLRGAPPSDRGRLARDLYTFAHFPIVAGTILYAVAAKKILAHSTDVLSFAGRFCLAAGIGLFLSGFVFGSHRAGGMALYERLGAMVLIAFLSLAPLPIPGLLLAAVDISVLAVALGLEARRRRRQHPH